MLRSECNTLLDLGSLFDSVSYKKFFLHIDFFVCCSSIGLSISLYCSWFVLIFHFGTDKLLMWRAKLSTIIHSVPPKRMRISQSLAFQCSFQANKKNIGKNEILQMAITNHYAFLSYFAAMTYIDTNYRHRLANEIAMVGERYRTNMLSRWEITFSFRFFIDDTYV